MNKREFLEALDAQLLLLLESEREQSLVFYGELIDECTATGATEEEVVAQLDTVDAIAEEILECLPTSQIQVRKPRSWENALHRLSASLRRNRGEGTWPVFAGANRGH